MDIDNYNVGSPGVGPEGRKGEVYVFPASYGQQRLWFLNQFEPGSSFYNIPLVARLKGLLNAEVLRRALNAIVARHEALRTTFATEDGKLLQLIASEAELPLPITDLAQLPDGEREVVTERLTRAEAEAPFDLAQGPLLRVGLLRLQQDEHVLLLTMHHICSDGWSMQVLLNELSSLYEAFSAGRASGLPELTVQYADFAQWQRELLQGAFLEDQLAYWRQQLDGAPALLEIPTDRPRPPLQTFRGDIQTLSLSKTLRNQLAELSRLQDVTIFMTLLAAFQTLLYRYSDRDDIVVGSPVANRSRSEIEDLIGFFVNSLVLRTDFSGNPSFLELLKRVREVALGAYAHQDLPFDKLVDELKPERSLSYSPLFQVIFAFDRSSDSSFRLPHLKIDWLDTNRGASKFDLALFVSEQTDGLSCVLEYDTELFVPATIERMLGHFQMLLEGIVSNPEQHVATLPLLTQPELAQLAIEQTLPAATAELGLCLHQRFERQAERTPENVALVFEDEQLTYSELNARANQLASYLKGQGVGPEVLVAICLERSLQMVIAVLGILKVGGAYVPLDPDYPKERLSFMLEDMRGPVLLTESLLRDRLPENAARIVCLDTVCDRISEESSDNLACETTVDNLAYVIYTSGSTGKPKGVQVTHRNVARLLDETWSWFHFDERDVWTLFHSYAFDFSVWEFWGALNYGGRLVVVPYWVSRSPELFYDLLCTQSVTVLNQTPSAFRQLIQAEESRTTHEDLLLRLVIFGGEALDLQSLRPWFERHGDQQPQLVNMYGITETTVHVTYRPLKMIDLERISASVIGGPIRDLQLYILDRYQQLVPRGIPGELYVGGSGTARGYLERPALTAERFIPDGISGQHGRRLYKTGDLVRQTANGELEYLGRVDSQVKVRGFRVELGEIEAVLAEHEVVRECAVTAREDLPGATRLVAYVVRMRSESSAHNEEFTASLRGFLKQRLPEYMVPSAFVLLASMPLTANGKVDRRALVMPAQTRLENETTYAAPRSLVEEKLAEIWANVLGVQKVGIHDNFFELGGDSILSIQIIAKANKAGFRLTPKQLFQHQTVAELAAVTHTGTIIEAQQTNVTGPVALTPIQHWFFEQNLPEPHHFNQAVLLEVGAPLDLSLLVKSVQHLLLHHDGLRLRFVQEQSGWKQFNAPPSDAVPFASFDLSSAPFNGRKAAMRQAIAELQASLNLSEGPLLRAAFFNLGAEELGRLFIVVHHLAIDGVSWRILLEDLHTAYQQLSRGEPVKLPAKTTSFKQWSDRLSDYAQTEVLRREESYWLKREREAAPLIPLDYVGGENTEKAAETVSVSLSIDETRALLQRVPLAYGTQINDVLLTGLMLAFQQWTGESSLLVDLEGHGREEIVEGVDLSRTIGWFTTIFPVVLRLSNDSELKDALKEIKRQLDAVPNRGIGYGLLRYLSGNTRVADELRSLPQPLVSFNYLGQFKQDRSQSDLFVITADDCGPVHSPRQTRRHLLSIDGLVIAGQLKLDWTFSSNLHKRETIETLANSFIRALQSFISNCQSPGKDGYRPSDFPLARLDQEALNELAAQLTEFDTSEEFLA